MKVNIFVIILLLQILREIYYLRIVLYNTVGMLKNKNKIYQIKVAQLKILSARRQKYFIGRHLCFY